MNNYINNYLSRGFPLTDCSVLDTTFVGSFRNIFCLSKGRAANSLHLIEQQPLKYFLHFSHWIKRIWQA